MKYYQTVLPFPLGSESFCFPTNTGERGDIAACYLLVPSFPQGMRLEQQLHIFLAPAGTSLWPHVLCHSPTQGTAHICHKQICALGTKIKYRGGKKKKLSHGEAGQTLAQSDWWACGVSILQETENPAGHCSEQSAAAASVSSRGRAGCSPGTPSCLNWSVSFA